MEEGTGQDMFESPLAPAANAGAGGHLDRAMQAP